MPAAPLLLAAMVAFLAWQARYEEVRHRQHEAEGVAQRLDELAWHLDHWIHDNPALTVTSPTSPRRLSAAETQAVADAAGFAAPWLLRSDVVSVEATAPAGARWHARFVVGWPSGQNPAAAGIGPPYGVVVATARGIGETQTIRVREALRRRGGGIASDVEQVASGAAAIDIATAAGISVDEDDVVAFSWRHAGILPDIALRRPRAGRETPGMGSDFQLAANATINRIEVIGDMGFASTAAAAAELETGQLTADSLTATIIELESDGAVAGNMAAGTARVQRFESPTQPVTNTGSASFRLAAVQGAATGTLASVQGGRVRQTLNTGRVDTGRATGLDFETPVLDLSAATTGTTRVIDRFYARALKLGANLDVSPPGICRGCLNDDS